MGLLERLGLRSPQAQADPQDESEATDYTSLSIRELELRAQHGDISTLSAVLAAMGVVARAFSLAKVEPQNNRTAGLEPHILGWIGASLVLKGEALLCIEVRGRRIELLPAQLVDVDGQADPRTWTYWLNLHGPRTLEYKALPAAGAVHVRNPDPLRPWRGLCPLPQSAARLAQEAERSLMHELAIPIANVSEMDGDKAGRKDFERGLAAGGLFVVGGATDQPEQREQPKRFEPARFGPHPDAQITQIRKNALMEVFSAVGLSTALFSDSSSGSREAWRQTYRNALLPFSRLAAAELAKKLNVPELRLDLSRLAAADIAVQASAYRRLAGSAEGADLTPEEARRLSGLAAD